MHYCMVIPCGAGDGGMDLCRISALPFTSTVKYCATLQITDDQSICFSRTLVKEKRVVYPSLDPCNWYQVYSYYSAQKMFDEMPNLINEVI